MDKLKIEKDVIILEIPRRILRQTETVAARFKCSVNTVILAGIIDVVDVGYGLIRVPISTREDFIFKLKIAEALETDREKVKNVVADYINAHQGYFTRFNPAVNSKMPWGLDNVIRGEVAGRYSHETNGVTLALPWNKLKPYAATKGVDKKSILRWAEGQGAVLNRNVMLSPGSYSTLCLILTVPEEQTISL